MVVRGYLGIPWPTVPPILAETLSSPSSFFTEGSCDDAPGRKSQAKVKLRRLQRGQGYETLGVICNMVCIVIQCHIVWDSLV